MNWNYYLIVFRLTFRLLGYYLAKEDKNYYFHEPQINTFTLERLLSV